MRVVDEDERLRQQLLLADAASGTPETVAEAILDDLFDGQTHIFPQTFAKVVSRLKRLAPGPMITVSVILTRHRGEKLLADARAAKQRQPATHENQAPIATVGPESHHSQGASAK